MKILKGTFSALLILSCITGFAQHDNRQKLFAAYPQTVSLDRSVFTNSIHYAEGSVVTVSFTPAFSFTGTVISNKRKYANLQTVIIRNADNTLLQVSEITNSDRSITYAGRLLSNLSADGYEIKNTNGVYSLQKFETARILEPCNF